jgi:zinc protease
MADRSRVSAGITVNIVACIVLAVAAGCSRRGEPVPETPSVPTLEFERYKLANGLDVILLEDHRLPLVAVNLWYHVGPANEREGRTGFAHLFEHMMFQGSGHVEANEHFRQLEAAGASDINGTTDFDRTNYFETLPSNRLELALWLESDRMGFLLDKLDARNLENQRDVVRNERRQSVENQPYGLVEEALYHQLFPKGHPYYASVIGSHADIEAVRLPDVREFFSLYYAPNNASLAIVGDIDKARTKSLVEKYFGPIPAGKPVPPVAVQTPPITAERRSVVTDQVELPRVYMGWITDPVYKPGDAECDLLARILGGGKSSRLYKKLVYDKQIAQDVSAQQYSLALGSVFTIQATAKPGVKPEDLEREIDAELDALRASGPTAEELARAQNMFESAIIRHLETLGGFGGVADRLNQYNHHLGDPGYLARDLGRYRTATTEALRKVAEARLGRAARVVIHAVNGAKKIEDVPRAQTGKHPITSTEIRPEAEWRKTPPPPGPASALQLPVPKTFKLANGLSVYLVEQHKLPVVAANLILLAGSEANSPKLPGLAAFTAGMLDEGTERRSALQLADDAEKLGATLATGSSTDLAFASVRTLRKTAEPALELLAEVALTPAFPPREIERIRKERLTQLLQQRDNPSALAGRTLSAAVFGPDHPYGYTELGTEDSLKAIGRDDILGLWRAGYTPDNAALVVAGNLTEADLRRLAEKYFGGWSGKSTVARPADPTDLPARRIVIVDKPAAPQTMLYVGHVGIARSSPDYEAVDVMNTGLGGLFSSRINLNLREQHGYTYGASSVFSARRRRGPFIVGTGVRTEVTAAAVTEIFKELGALRTKPFTPEELATAKDSIARSLPGQFETTPQTASSIGQLFVHGLPLDYYGSLPGKVAAVGAAEVTRVAERYLHPEATVIVAVGDRKKIEPELRKLDLGPVELRDRDGKPVASK